MVEQNIEKHKIRNIKGGWVDPSTLPRNNQGFRQCRWCNGSVIPPKRTFCSAECVHQHRLRTQPRYLRQCCYDRDKGICSNCGIDTKQTAKMARSFTTGSEELKGFLKQYNITIKRKIHKRKLGGGLWDADHINPVVQGGGLCGLENIQTLCIACHKIKTKNMNLKK